MSVCPSDPPADEDSILAAIEAVQEAAASAARALTHVDAELILRAEIVRELVDEHGYALAEVGRSMRISRQMASRLLEARRSGTRPGE
jgi:ActR/RegA family two-component response regulator